MVGLFLVSFALRFWGLGRFNTLVFDEVYYAKFASHFLKGEILFVGHPPLSTYIIALGIWIGNHLPWGQDPVKNGLAGLYLAPFSYRWLNALTGSFIPLLIAAIAYQLNHRRSYAFIAGLLIAADGLFLVESRYALNNIYLIGLGLLGQLFFLLALQASHWRRWAWLAAAGVGFGASAAIKWNGLGFLLGAYLVWATGWVLRWVQSRRRTALSLPNSDLPKKKSSAGLRTPLENLSQIHLGHILVNLVLIPAVTYYVAWLPYMHIDPSGSSFWDLQRQTLEYHERVGGLHVHPYCSLWFTWPLMLRPIAYFYKTAQSFQVPVPVIGPPLPNSAGQAIYDVHAMGNPILWWFSSAAIAILIGLLLLQTWRWITTAREPDPVTSANATNSTRRDGRRGTGLTPYGWIALYLVLNWVANLLPWIEITRCAFLYHYMESLVFSILALALFIDRWIRSPKSGYKVMGFALIGLILAGFVFWMPIYLGLPLSPEAIQMRRWLTSWI
jgi:dolichyl-phosphate-mannose--protein O-mannosyl transferase